MSQLERMKERGKKAGRENNERKIVRYKGSEWGLKVYILINGSCGLADWIVSFLLYLN